MDLAALEVVGVRSVVESVAYFDIKYNILVEATLDLPNNLIAISYQ